MSVTAKAWSGANGNVVIKNVACTFAGLNYNNNTGAPVTVTVFDNATTNTGTILLQVTAAANTADTLYLPSALKCANGITVNSGAAIGAGAVYGY